MTAALTSQQIARLEIAEAVFERLRHKLAWRGSEASLNNNDLYDIVVGILADIREELQA